MHIAWMHIEMKDTVICKDLKRDEQSLKGEDAINCEDAQSKGSMRRAEKEAQSVNQYAELSYRFNGYDGYGNVSCKGGKMLRHGFSATYAQVRVGMLIHMYSKRRHCALLNL